MYPIRLNLCSFVNLATSGSSFIVFSSRLYLVLHIPCSIISFSIFLPNMFITCMFFCFVIYFSHRQHRIDGTIVLYILSLVFYEYFWISLMVEVWRRLCFQVNDDFFCNCCMFHDVDVMPTCTDWGLSKFELFTEMFLIGYSIYIE